MELFALLVIGAVLLLPVTALLFALSARSQARSMRHEIRDLEARLHRAESRARELADWLSWWTARTERRLASAPVPPDAAPPQPEPAAALEPQPEADEAAAAAAEEEEDERTSPTEPEVAPAPLSRPPTSAMDWENLIGVRLFAWVGGGALFLGAALFLHYSIQQNLISPAVRVAVGLAAGSFALFLGDRLRKRTDVAGQALAGAGVAILYASLFAARSLYHLLDSATAFIGMGLVTVTAGVVAVKRSAFVLALLGLIGGMATPYLLSEGEDRPVALLLYVALLDAGVVAVDRRRSWPVLSLLGLTGSLLIFTGWSLRYLDAPRAPFALGALALVMLLFALNGKRARQPSEGEAPILPRAVMVFGAVAPLAAVLLIAGAPSLSLEPWVLAAYLLMLSAGAWYVGRSAAAESLPVLAAVLALLALVLRARPDVIDARRLSSLASFSLVPLGYFMAWLWRRREHDQKSLRLAATILLAGAALVVTRTFDDPAQRSQWPALVYAAVHAAGLVAIGALDAAGGFLIAGQLVSAVALVSLSFVNVNQGPQLTELSVSASVAGLTFWALPLVSKRFRPDVAAWLSSALALPLHFLVLYGEMRDTWSSEALGCVAVVGGALSLACLSAVRRERPGARDSLLLPAVFGGVTLGFLTAAIPIVLSDEWLTVSWALELAGLAWLRRRVPHRLLFHAIALLGAAVTLRLLANPALWHYHERSATPILNFYLYTFGVPALCFLFASKWLDLERPPAPWRLVPALRFAATVLLFVLLNVEIADYYSNGQTIEFRLSGGGLAEDTTYSLAWGVFAIVLLVLGISRQRRAPRIAALAVLTLTIGKVFLHDLWELGSLYRVGSIVGLALALLGVSFLTQRFVLKKESA